MHAKVPSRGCVAGQWSDLADRRVSSPSVANQRIDIGAKLEELHFVWGYQRIGGGVKAALGRVNPAPAGGLK